MIGIRILYDNARLNEEKAENADSLVSKSENGYELNPFSTTSISHPIDPEYGSISHDDMNLTLQLDDQKESKTEICDIEIESTSLVTTFQSILSNILHPQALEVALIVLGNSGDNIAVYVPIFISQKFSMLIVFSTFYVCLTFMLYISSNLVKAPMVNAMCTCYGIYIAGFGLISIGLYILSESIVWKDK